MKRIIGTKILFILCANLSAQKVAYVDTDLILSKLPAYQVAQKQMDELTEKWKTRIEQGYTEVEAMYQKYQAEEALYSDEMRRRKQTELAAKEKAVKDLQDKYFGTEGELFQKRKELIAPIQDDIYNSIKTIAEEGNLVMVFDKSTGNLLYAQPRADKSEDVLNLLGQ